MVCNLPALNSVPVAEHTVSLLMAAAKRLPMLDRGVRSSEWGTTRNLNAPVELRGKTLGVSSVSEQSAPKSQGSVVLDLACRSLRMTRMPLPIDSRGTR